MAAKRTTSQIRAALRRARQAEIRKQWLIVVAVAGAAMPVSVLASACPALAALHHPRGAFSVFADCPLNDPAVTQCLVASVTGGEFVLGKRRVPITKTITLQGGMIPVGLNAYVLAGAQDGDTFSKVALPVEGGLLGTGGSAAREEVTAIAELAQPPSAVKLSIANLLFGEGVALAMPLKVKLSNPLLEGDCYLGGETTPIVIAATAGKTSPPPPNHSIVGSIAEVAEVVEHKVGMVAARGASLVDDSFAVPGASGCGDLGDALVDAAIGLPSPAGHNTAILDANVDLATAEHVRASEQG